MAWTRRVVIGVTLVALGCGGGSPAEPKPGAEAEAPAAKGQRSDVDIHGFVAAYKEGVQVLDVRTAFEYNRGHVPGAVHLPVGQIRPDHPLLAQLNADEPVYVVCETGKRSSRAANLLSREGFHAINVEGGTRAWRGAGQEVE